MTKTSPTLSSKNINTKCPSNKWSIILAITLLIFSGLLIFSPTKSAISLPGEKRILANLVALIGPILYIISFTIVCRISTSTTEQSSKHKFTQYLFYFYLLLSIIFLFWILALYQITHNSAYNISILIAVVLGGLLCAKNSTLLQFSKKQKIILFSYILLGAVIGAKYYTFLATMNLQGKIFDIFSIGLSSYGALIGILIMFLIFSRQFRKSYLDLLYIFAPSVLLMYSIGKIGCSIVGCCYGIQYNGIFSISYGEYSPAPTGIKLFPIQPLESLVFFIIFLYIQKRLKNKANRANTVGIAFLMGGGAKFLLEFLRMSHQGKIISSTQWVSLICITIGITIIWRNYYKQKTHTATNQA